MTWTHEIWRLCQPCKGTGQVVNIPDNDVPEQPVESEDIDCPRCEGRGRYLWGGLKEKE